MLKMHLPGDAAAAAAAEYDMVLQETGAEAVSVGSSTDVAEPVAQLGRVQPNEKNNETLGYSWEGLKPAGVRSSSS